MTPNVLDVRGLRGNGPRPGIPGDPGLDVQMEFSGVPNVPMQVVLAGWYEPHSNPVQEGELTNKTAADSGEATVVVGLGVMAGDIVDVSWTGGVRNGMTVSKVINIPEFNPVYNVLVIDGGAGDPLPPKDTFLEVTCRNPGMLTTWTDADTGQVGLNPGHGIASGDIVDVWWVGGSRARMTVGNVINGVNDVLDVDGGTGASLPPADTAVVVTRIPSSDLVLQIYNDTWSTWDNVTGNSEDIYSGTSEQTYVYDLPVDLTEYITGGDNGTLRLRVYGARRYNSPGRASAADRRHGPAVPGSGTFAGHAPQHLEPERGSAVRPHQHGVIEDHHFA